MSILVAGVTAQYFDWPWAFAIAGTGGLAALLIVSIVLPSREPDPAGRGGGSALDFRPAFRDRAAMPYIFASLGTAWEVFSSRVWLVTFFLYLQSRLSEGEAGWSGAVWSTVVALVGVPAAMVIGEYCVRYDRRKILMGIAALSALLAIFIGQNVDGTYEFTLIVCVIFGMTFYGRSATITAGTVSVVDPARRGSALAVLAFIGFSGGILGPLAFGIALDSAGGSGSSFGWQVAMAVMAFGPVIAILSLLAGAYGVKCCYPWGARKPHLENQGNGASHISLVRYTA